MSRAHLGLLALAWACGGSQGGGADPCLEARLSGPPLANLDCPPGTESRSRIERRGASRIPTASGRRGAATDFSESAWCATADDTEEGPFVVVDAERRVTRSGGHAGGEPTGTWIAWDGGAPIAVTVYGDGGKLLSERVCR